MDAQLMCSEGRHLPDRPREARRFTAGCVALQVDGALNRVIQTREAKPSPPERTGKPRSQMAPENTANRGHKRPAQSRSVSTRG